MSPARGLYLARAVKILSPLTAGCESTLHEKAPASGYTLPIREMFLLAIHDNKANVECAWWPVALCFLILR